MQEQSKRIARRFAEAFVAGDSAVLSQVVREDHVDHNPRPGQSPGRQAVIEAAIAFHNAFPDLSTTVEQTITEGDLVVQCGVMTGTNTGSMMGQPATNKPVVVAWMDMHRIEGGQIVESWHLEDVAGMLRQLGVMSPS